jgi:hypothetical protein
MYFTMGRSTSQQRFGHALLHSAAPYLYQVNTFFFSGEAAI